MFLGPFWHSGPIWDQVLNIGAYCNGWTSSIILNCDVRAVLEKGGVKHILIIYVALFSSIGDIVPCLVGWSVTTKGSPI